MAVEIVEGIFRNKWDGIFPADIAEYMDTNNIDVSRDPRHKSILIGTLRGSKSKNAVFRYDRDNYILYSDYTPLDFVRGRVKKLHK